MTNRSARTTATLVFALLAALGGCGVQREEGPRVLPAANVPYGLLEEVPSTTTSVRRPTPSVAKSSVFVFFVRGGRMYPVVREVNAPVTVGKSLTALVFGTLEDESAQGIRSAINPAAGVQARSIDPASVLVDLSPEFVQGPTSEQVLGLAQIVYTATEVTGITGVRFTLNGASIEVPTPSGSLISGAVGRDAFADFAPVPPGIDLPS